MRKFILGLLLGTVLGSVMGAYAYTITKIESKSTDAASIVGYGVYNNKLVPILVGSDGTLQLH
jgi:hypothetical protein